MVEVLEDIVAGNYFDPHVSLQRALAVLDSLSGRVQGSGIRALRGLHAVLHLSYTGCRGLLMLEPFVHSSFPEFIANPQLSFELAIDLVKGHKRLLWKCLQFISSISMQSKVEEESLQFSLCIFRPVWLSIWGRNEAVRLWQAEYIKVVQKLLAIDLTTCSLKLYSHSGPLITTAAYVYSYRTDFIDSFKNHHFGGELKSLVQQACFHVQSSTEGALIHVIQQLQQGVACPGQSLFSQELIAHLRYIYSTKSNEWKLNCVVQALIDLRCENEEGFRGLTRTLELWLNHENRPVLDYISQDED
jgi:hypothetical protein